MWNQSKFTYLQIETAGGNPIAFPYLALNTVMTSYFQCIAWTLLSAHAALWASKTSACFIKNIFSKKKWKKMQKCLYDIHMGSLLNVILWPCV